MSDSNVTGKTQAELDQSGHYVSQITGEVKTPWGHGTGHQIGNSGKAESAK